MKTGVSPITLDGSSLSLEQLATVARDPRVPVTFDAKAMERVRRCAAAIDAIVQNYRKQHEAGLRGSDLPHVYGITTGYGEFKTQTIHPDALAELQANILRSHATGVGDTTDADDRHNYFPAEVIRATLVLRLNTFLKGHSGIRPEMVLFIRDMINAGVVPLVPTRGSVGSSGDLCPLAHLFVLLLGEESSGRFYVTGDGDDVRFNRGPVHAARELGAVMSRRLQTSELTEKNLGPSFRDVPKPGPKEGLALTNGATFSTAQLALAARDAQQLANVADVASAMTLEAVCGRTRALDEKIHRVRGMRGQMDSAANIRRILGDAAGGGESLDRGEELQDAYSIRCAPQVHGASRDAIAYAHMVVQAEMNAATDNPLFFPGDSEPWDVTRSRRATGDGTAYSAGNFHGQPVGLAADFLAIALAELADISERRTQMLLDKHHNRGLPPCLTANPGVNSGLMLAQYCAASLVSENKVLAHPASVDSIPTSANAEDHVAMASIAARKLRSVLGNTQAVLAIELMTAAQALDWRVRMMEKGDPLPAKKECGHAEASWMGVAAEFSDRLADKPHRQENLSPGVGAALEVIRKSVEPVRDDRVLSEDIIAIRRLIENNSLLRGVEERVGALKTIPPLRG